VEISVCQWVTLKRLQGLYFERPKSVGLVLDYIGQIGFRATLAKIVSRTAERFRNEKYLSVGIGRAVGSEYCGRTVFFIAPCHPRFVDRISLPPELVGPIDNLGEMCVAPDVVKFRDLSASGAEDIAALADLGGWNPDSGVPPGNVDWCRVRDVIRQCADGRRYPLTEQLVATTAAAHVAPSGLVVATLFGYGNYAKTVILPNLPKDLTVRRIHEIDPLQVPLKRDPAVTWSTSPDLSADDQGSVVFIAGYHHSHGSLAVAALAGNKDCVVEKPLVTSRAQLAELDLALQKSSGRYFACFQKRYSRFNDWARSDLGVKAGDPINYHAIVYEVPLPDKHWYRWASSRSRLVSNGCHWVDHFLFLNEWSEPQRWDVQAAADGTLSVFISLRNGACMTMTLTDIGSERIGVQDHIQLRAGRVTVRLNNDSDYVAEDSSRILRRSRINKMTTYRDMYAQIGRKIVAGSPGDSRQSILSSASLVLDLEDAMSLRDPNPDA
jgi:predicted dehydrogenase